MYRDDTCMTWTVIRESCETDSQGRNLVAFRKQRIFLFGELKGSKIGSI